MPRIPPCGGDPRERRRQALADLGAAALNRIREGKEKTYSLNEVITELGLDASDL